MGTDSPEKYLPQPFLPEWVWSPGATVESLYPDKCKTWIQMPLPRAASESEVWSSGNGCSMLASWLWEKPCWLEYLPSMDWGRCFRIRRLLFERGEVLLSAQGHYWHGFLKHRRRTALFPYQDGGEWKDILEAEQGVWWTHQISGIEFEEWCSFLFSKQD